VKIEIPAKLQFLFRPKRLKIAFGGRGGYKTVSFSKALLFLAHKERKSILCLREFMNSIDDSVHSTLKAEVDNLDMADRFKVTNNQIENIHNDSLFRYGSLARNLPSLKSRHGIDIAWVEEAETITQKSLDVLFPTIRKPDSEIWMSFNPDDEFGAVYHTFVKPHLDIIRSQGFYEDENIYIVKTSLEDNPFAPVGMLEESARLKKDNLKKWLHIYGGEVFSDYRESIIQPEWVDAAIDAHLKLKFPAQGVKVTAFDPADTGKDAKAQMFRHGSVITEGRQWSEGELPEAIDKAFSRAYDLRMEQFVYDATGIGRGVKVGLEKRIEGKNLEVIPFEGAAKVDLPEEKYAADKSNRDTFKNKRAQYFWKLRDRFEATFNAIKKGLYTDPDNLISISSEVEDLDILKSELVKIRRKIGQNAYIQIESKEDMLKRGVKSPNMADALSMVFANPAPFTAVPDIQFLSEF